MKDVVFVICVIIVFITNYIWYRRGLVRGMEYSVNATYDIFMDAIYVKLKRENKTDKEAELFMKDVHNLLGELNSK